MHSYIRAATATFTLAALTAAHAAPIGTDANIDFGGSSVSFGYLGSQFTFTDLGNGPYDPTAISVTTGAGAQATVSPAIFGSKPSTYFDPVRGDGPLTFDGTSAYASFSNAPIPYSLTAGFIGLSLTLADGVHYGFARFAGTELRSYAFESVAGVGINASSAVLAVPEPATWALMLGGLGVVGGIARRRKTAPSSAA